MLLTALPAYGGVLLQRGSQGPDVALVQTWLAALALPACAARDLSIDGKFGAGTTAAVRIFQEAEGLQADGKVGEQTWNRLYSRYAAQAGEGESYPGIPLRQGDRGATVQSAQEKLRSLLPELTADGRYGPGTRDAVRAFQICQHLPHDGILGRVTWQALYGQEEAAGKTAPDGSVSGCGCR